MRNRPWLKWLLIGGGAVIVLAVAGPFVYFNFIQDDAPDEFSLDDLRTAVELNRAHDHGPIKLEASGGVSLETLRDIAETGIDFIKQRLTTRRIKLYEDALEETDPELEMRHLPTCLAEEIPLLEWAKSAQNSIQEKNPKDEPADLHNHGIDCARYICNAIDKGRGVFARAL